MSRVAAKDFFAPKGARTASQTPDHGLQPWLASNAAPRLNPAHSEFLDLMGSEFKRSNRWRSAVAGLLTVLPVVAT